MKTIHLRLAALALAAWIGGQAVWAEGWSPSSLFSTKKSEPQQKKPVPPKFPSKPPSTLDKAGTGTKNFFTGIGDTLSGKKSTTKKSTPSSPLAMGTKPTKPAPAAKKPTQQSSWNPFRREEQKKPQSLKDFVGMQRPD
jgi:hypothetical protein